MRAFRLVAAAGVCALLIAAAASAAAAGDGGAPTAAGNRAAAARDARGRLAAAALPPGAVALQGAPAGGAAIDNPDPAESTPDFVDAHAWWRVPGTLAAAMAFERAHAPAGSQPDGSGGGTTLIGATKYSWSYVEFAFPARPGVLGSRTLIVKGVALGADAAALRIDAQDIWQLPRPAGERIPAGVREIDVARSARGGEPALSVKVTDAAKVRAIVALIDALPIVQPVEIACPMMPLNGPTVSFTFRAGAGGAVLAQASQVAFPGPATACDPMSLTINARKQTPLLGGSGFLAATGRLLGLTLAASG